MGWSTSMCFQNDQTQKSIGQVWWWGRPNVLTPEMRKIILTPFLSFVGRVNGLFLKRFLASARAGIKIASMYELVLTLAPCGTKMTGDFHVWKHGPHHDRGRFLTPENLSHRVRNVFRRLSKDTIICRLNTASSLNTFLLRNWFSSEKLHILQIMLCAIYVPIYLIVREQAQ